MPDRPQFQSAIERFDALNAADPHGKELTYARRMTQWLEKLEPAASESLRLAARGQHLMRWKIPRESFPKDRAGYLRWRTTLYDFHADRAAEVLREGGYDDATIARVRSLIRKENLKSDPEAQALEDVVCIVFLENYFAEFARDHDEAKLIRIVQKTWKKMSPRGRAVGVTLAMAENEMKLIAKALSPSSSGG